MAGSSTLQSPRVRRGAGRRYYRPFDRLKRRERAYRRFALAVGIVLIGVLTVLLLKLIG